MIMDAKCINCKWWELCLYDINGDSIGTCKNDKLSHNRHNSTPVDGISINGMHLTDKQISGIHVGQDFGCIHFEAKGS